MTANTFIMLQNVNIFEIYAVLLNFLFIKDSKCIMFSTKTLRSVTVFNISVVANQHIRMISAGSLNCNNISQFYSIFDQINALQSFLKVCSIYLYSEYGRGVPVSFWAG